MRNIPFQVVYQGEQHRFGVGERVRFNELGRATFTRIRSTAGVVVGVGGVIAPSSISVRLDGNKGVSRFHSGYFEPENKVAALEQTAAPIR